jgi:hypothetical protein
MYSLGDVVRVATKDARKLNSADHPADLLVNCQPDLRSCCKPTQRLPEGLGYRRRSRGGQNMSSKPAALTANSRYYLPPFEVLRVKPDGRMTKLPCATWLHAEVCSGLRAHPRLVMQPTRFGSRSPEARMRRGNELWLTGTACEVKVAA